MGVIDRAGLKQMIGFVPDGAFVVSLYLNVDGAKYPRLQDYEKELHALVGRAQKEWLSDSETVDKQRQRFLKRDLEKISGFVTGNWRRQGSKGLAIFSCDSSGFWHVYELPVGVPSALIVGNEPYAKTLTAVLDEYKRFCVIVIDRKKARFFTVYLGEIEEHQGVFIDEFVPDQVKEGEWAGLRQSRIARHIEDHVLHHLKDVAGRAFNFFLEHNFDRLILAGQKELIHKFQTILHPYLQERVAGDFPADPDAPLNDILEKSLAVEQDVERREEETLLNRLAEESRPGGLGVAGLEATVDVLQRGQVHTLLIEDGFSTAGHVCFRDHFLALAPGDCPVCANPLTGVPDIVEDTIQLAINQNVRVEHISHVTERLDRDKVGALLRFGL